MGTVRYVVLMTAVIASCVFSSVSADASDRVFRSRSVVVDRGFGGRSVVFDRGFGGRSVVFDRGFGHGGFGGRSVIIDRGGFGCGGRSVIVDPGFRSRTIFRSSIGFGF